MDANDYAPDLAAGLREGDRLGQRLYNQHSFAAPLASWHTQLMRKRGGDTHAAAGRNVRGVAACDALYVSPYFVRDS